MPSIVEYSNEFKPQVKDFVICAHEEFGFPYDSVLDADLDDLTKTYIDSGGNFYLLLEKGKVIGTTAVKKLGPNIGEIKRMYIAKEYRGQGYGSALLDQAIASCKEAGFSKCILDTNIAQLDAQKLYKSRGFRIYKQEGGSLFMEKELTRI